MKSDGGPHETVVRSVFQIVLLAGAGALALASVSAHTRITTTITWEKEIAPIVAARCVSCHVGDGDAPMPLTTWAQARPWARAIREEVLTRRMPKWHAARGYGRFANDPSLSPFEIGLIVAWVDGGAPEGRRIGPLQREEPPQDAASLGATPLEVPCGEQPLPAGRLTAFQPRLPAGGSARIAALPAQGDPEILAWIRDFDPTHPTIYQLREPLDFAPGSRLLVQAPEECAIRLVLDPPGR